MSFLFAFLLGMFIAVPSQQMQSAEPTGNNVEALRKKDDELKVTYPGYTRFQRQLTDCGQQLKEQLGEPVAPQDLEACITYARFITDTLDKADGE